MQPDYQTMYAILCGAASDALDALPVSPETRRGRFLLENALEQAEELYLRQESADHG